MVRLEPGELRPAEELERFIAGLAGDGAVVSFVGLARGADAAGEKVTGLFLDSYPGMTEKSLEAIAAAARENFLDRASACHAIADDHQSLLGRHGSSDLQQAHIDDDGTLQTFRRTDA